MKAFLMVLGLFATFGVVAAQEEPYTLRTFDVSSLTVPHRSRIGPRLGPWNPHFPGEEEPEYEPRAFLEGDAIADIIRDTITLAVWDEGGDVMYRQGGRLIVKAPRSTLGRIEDLIAEMDSQASRRIHFSVEVRDLPAADYAKYALSTGTRPGAAGLRESVSGESYPGAYAAAKVTNRVRYVADYDVEIAQGAMLSDPVVLAAEEGLVLDLRAHPTMDGSRLIVETYLQSGDIEQPMPEATLAVDEEYFAEGFRSDTRRQNGTMQLPRFDGADAFSTRIIKPGERFEVPLVIGDRMRLFSITAKLLGGDGSPRVLDVGALAHRPTTHSIGYSGEEEGYRVLMAPRLIRSEGERANGPEEIMDLIVQNTSPEYWEEAGAIGVMGSQLFVHAEPVVLSGVRRFYAGLERDFLAQVKLDLRVYSVTGRLPAGEQAGFTLPEGSRLEYAGAVATLPRRRACFRAGNTQNFIADYDVEVAQEARIADPIIGQSFEGIVANLRPTLTPGKRRILLEYELLIARRTSTEVFDPRTQYLGPIDTLNEKRTVLNSTAEFAPDSVYVIDAGPDVKDPNRRLCVVIRAKVD